MMGCVQLLLLCSLWSSSILSSMSLTVSQGALGDENILESHIRTCKGIELELRDCNGRLTEKTLYATNADEEIFDLKRQLRQCKLSCKTAAQAADMQIAALQAQLDSLLKQLGEKATGPAKNVVDILQQYVAIKKLELNIAVETEPAKLAALQEKLKKSIEELKTLTGNLSPSDCKGGGDNNSLTAEISKLQVEIDKLQSGSGGPAQSSKINELKRQLREKLQQLISAGDDSSKQVVEIIKQQEDFKVIQSKLADLLKTQEEFKALQARLRDLTFLLSDLKEEKKKGNAVDKEIAATEKEISEVKGQLQAVNHSLSQKEDLEKQFLEKKKQIEDKINGLQNSKQELLARILSLQLELQETQVRAQAEKMAAEFQIQDLQKLVRMKEERISKLLGRNRYLETKLEDLNAVCDDLQASYDQLLTQINDLSDGNLKQTFEIISLSNEIDSIRSQIASETSESKIKELNKLLQDKINQFNSKKQELQKKDPDADKILSILGKMEEIQRLQGLAKLENLDQIRTLQQDLLKEINRLSDSSPVKLVLKNMALLSDVNWIQRLIGSVSLQSRNQISALQEQLKKKEELLNKTMAELASKEGEVGRLSKRVADLTEELKKLKETLTKLEISSAAQVRDLESQLDKTKQELDKVNKALSSKDAELAKKVKEITKLLEDVRQAKLEVEAARQQAAEKINDLNKRLQKSEEEKSEIAAENTKLQQQLEEAKNCTEFQIRYDVLQAKYKEKISNMSNTLARQVLTIQTLSVEVEALKDKLSQSEGKNEEAAALRKQLEEKNSELSKVKNELQEQKVYSADLLKLLESLRKLSRQQEQSIAEYLAEIHRLEAEIEGLMIKVSNTGDDSAKLTIEVIALKEQLANLEKVKSQVEKEASEKIAALEKDIEEKNKEIKYLKNYNCEDIKKQVEQLRRDLGAKEQEVDNLKKSRDADVRELQKKITELNKDLGLSADKLKEKDAENAELIKQAADLGEQLKEAAKRQENVKQSMQKQIDDLKEQLGGKEKDVSDLKNSIAGLQEQVKNRDKKVAELQDQTAALNEDLVRKQDKLTQAEQDVKNKEATITDLNNKLHKKDQEQGVALKENELLRNQVTEIKHRLEELQNVSSENDRLKEELMQTNAKLEELENQGKVPPITVVSPVLDPDTAHRRLYLSDDGQSARGGDFPRLVLNGPKRYDSALAAVAKTGYDTGRIYWEVQVGTRACFVVGVARKSAQRKGELTYGPQNGYWGILKRKDGRYLALTEPYTFLMMTERPTAIGVLVDFSKKEIAFYSPKSPMPLYTFQNNVFTESLYPYIETCTDQYADEPSIAISKAPSISWLQAN
ncbi:COP1-interactive protein 1-like [Pygocentrus nattereri]|uniref:B30.2/SPRY domain-containing protein n=1 Tax=Pygocentrus nattereri TaxID=42514 RepID=A0A3B4BNU3_PYGNA|nr:COP1-interactive protein 1-like [Pygocentrus nattereri]